MANSYGVQTVPEWAKYGWYDVENGEWTGGWFRTREEAEAEAKAHKDDPEVVSGDFGIYSTDPNDSGVPLT